MAAWDIYRYSIERDPQLLALAVILVVIATGQRVIGKIEKGRK
jgi:hypothetical protein